MNRGLGSLAMALVACHGSSVVEPDARPRLGHVALLGSCAQAIAADGNIDFPDTIAAVQTSFRAIEVVDDGGAIVGYDPTNPAQQLQITVDGPDAAEFAVGLDMEGLADTRTCGFGFNGHPNGMPCHFSVSFQPTTPGPKSALLHVANLDIDQVFAIHATAVTEPAGLIASVTDLYLVPGMSATFTLTNNSATPVSLGAPETTLSFASADWSCAATLAPGASCLAAVTYTPTHGTSGCPSGVVGTTATSLALPVSGRGNSASEALAISVHSMGRVVVDPGGTACTATAPCNLTFAPTQALTLTATPEAGGQFRGWIDAAGLSACGTSPTCTLPAGFASVSLEAVFVSAAAKHVAVTIIGSGRVAELALPFDSCTTSCTLTAEPGTAFDLKESSAGTFDGWSGVCFGSQDTCHFGTVTTDQAITATFTP